MLFDPSLVAATIYATGTVTTVPYSGGDGLGNWFNRAVVSHGRTFPMPPIVVPYEVVGNERRFHLHAMTTFPNSTQAMRGFASSVRATNTGFELYTGNSNFYQLSEYAPGTTWRYVTLSNTLANS